MAEPDLLILDEPTIGLDPNQIRQVRDLIKSLGKRHTILLSTHILPEVEMTCNRVIILHKGRIEASDTPANLLGQLRAVGNIRLEASTGSDDAIEYLQKVPGIKEVALETAANATGIAEKRAGEANGGPADGGGSADGFRAFLLRVEAGADPRSELFRLAVDRHWTLRELARRRATLEDVFVEITHAE